MPEPVRRPLSTLDLPLLKAYVEAVFALRFAEHEKAHDPTRDCGREKADRDEAWRNLVAGA